MATPFIKFYPVHNGDTVLIGLSDDAHILVDCHITTESEEDGDDRFDVRKDLVDLLSPKKGAPHLDAFVLTHLDRDHCGGFGRVFHQGDPDDWKEPEEDEPATIIVDELWFTPRVFNETEDDLSDSAEAFQKEANRRLKLHRDKKDGRDDAGNRIRIVGWTGADDLKGLEHLVTVPGNTTNTVNTTSYDDFDMFIHAPFKEMTDDAKADRNDTSIVMQLRFDVDEVDRSNLVLLGGDAHWPVWEKIVELSKEKDYEWDLLLAPHHCSWTYFNANPYKDNSEPKEASVDVLEARTGDGAYIVASCKEIKKSDSPPPHHEAKKVYLKHVKADHFLVTGEHPNTKEPKPIRFDFTSDGPSLEPATRKRSGVAASVSSVATIPKSYG